jgi:hypothetical protein
MICKPSKAAAATDVFGFSEPDAQGQTLRNMTIMMALPWAAAWALSAELAAEAMKRAGF